MTSATREARSTIQALCVPGSPVSGCVPRWRKPSRLSCRRTAGCGQSMAWCGAGCGQACRHCRACASRLCSSLASCSAADARAGVIQAAALHAPSWGHAEILATEWLQPKPEVSAHVQALYPNAQAIFRERYADSLEPEFMAVCEELAEAGPLWFGRDQEPQCLIHGDFRLDNMLFDIKGGAEEIAVLDWQTVAIGSGLTDIGYFLGTGIGDDLRRAHEAELLDLYCAEMTARDVALTRDAIWDDYVIGALHGISTAVFSAAYVERTERGDANFLSMARGGCALALQHGSIAKLRG